MKDNNIIRRTLTGITGWLLSVPIYFKILGIGALVAVIFGGVTLYQIRSSMVGILYQMLEEETRSTAISLSSQLEGPMITNDLYAIHQTINRTFETSVEVLYVIVQDQNGRIVDHSFKDNIPPDLLAAAPQEIPLGGHLQVLEHGEGLIFEASALISDGHAGRLRVGISDEMITHELSSTTRSVLWALILCMVIGQGLALILTYILTRPIHHLVEATNSVRKGDFETRAQISSSDEIGELASAFNQMAGGLQTYRRDVEDKEAERLSLVEKIVLAQEEERKSISRELHDQLGQSLLAILLTVQAMCKEGSLPSKACQDIESKVHVLIDEVHRLAYGMRPSILDDYGLDSALDRYLQDMTEHSDVTIDYQSISPSEDGRLPGRIEVTLYRIAQEAITNIIRHARAQRASVILHKRPDEVTLLVEDDGVGFDPAMVVKSQITCLGFVGMRERSTLLGGDFSVESAPGSGTSIRIKIPLD